MGFFDFLRKGKPDEQPAPSTFVSEPDKALSCPFCGESFKVRQIVFAVDSDSNNGSIDDIHNQFIAKNFLNGQASTEYRRYTDDWKPEDVITWESECTAIPLTIKATFRKNLKQAESATPAAQKQIEDDGLGLDSVEQDIIPMKQAPDTPEETTNERFNSTHRLCPHCHCVLPEGTGIYREVRVGLYGGSRSGKTTYMAMVSKYIEERLNSLALGDGIVVQESSDVLKKIYLAASNSSGTDPTETDKPCFPIILTITPKDDRFAPFFLVFQDIPGEYAQDGHQTKLVNHPFTRSCAFLGVVDINMFVQTSERRRLNTLSRDQETAQQELKTIALKISEASSNDVKNDLLNQQEKLIQEADRKAKEIKVLENSICQRGYNEIFGNLPFAKLMTELHSAQIMFTKLDSWMESEENFQACEAVTMDHTNEHSEFINAPSLDLMNDQLHQLLKNYPGLSDNTGRTILQWFVDKLPKSVAHSALTAVSSRKKLSEDLAGNINAFADTINLLSPILNICRWEHLLPVREANTSMDQ